MQKRLESVEQVLETLEQRFKSFETVYVQGVEYLEREINHLSRHVKQLSKENQHDQRVSPMDLLKQGRECMQDMKKDLLQTNATFHFYFNLYLASFFVFCCVFMGWLIGFP